MEKTLLEEISDVYPEMTGQSDDSQCALAAFLFTGDDVYKRISGFKRRRAWTSFPLRRLMLSKSNFLILDEPTNHLDIVSKEILEKAIQTATPARCSMSPTTVILSTQTATRILELTGRTA